MRVTRTFFARIRDNIFVYHLLINLCLIYRELIATNQLTFLSLRLLFPALLALQQQCYNSFCFYICPAQFVLNSTSIIKKTWALCKAGFLLLHEWHKAFFLRNRPCAANAKIVATTIVASLMSRVSSPCVMLAPSLFALGHANLCTTPPTISKCENTLRAIS